MEKSWANLASRVVRVVLARKDVRPSSLVELLKEKGVSYSAKTLTEKISKGFVSLSDFVCILAAVQHEMPRLWTFQFIEKAKDVESKILCQQPIEAAKAVMKAERDRRADLDDELLEQLMWGAGSEIRGERFAHDLNSGEMLLRDFLVLLYCSGSSSLDGYLCEVDVEAVASNSVRKVTDREV